MAGGKKRAGTIIAAISRCGQVSKSLSGVSALPGAHQRPKVLPVLRETPDEGISRSASIEKAVRARRDHPARVRVLPSARFIGSEGSPIPYLVGRSAESTGFEVMRRMSGTCPQGRLLTRDKAPRRTCADFPSHTNLQRPGKLLSTRFAERCFESSRAPRRSPTGRTTYGLVHLPSPLGAAELLVRSNLRSPRSHPDWPRIGPRA